jgi:hypothetical protein
MDLNKLISIIGAFVPITAAATAIVKGVLGVDPPETVYEQIMKAPPEKRSELLTKYTACNDITDDLEGFINDIEDVVIEYVNKASRGEAPDVRVFADRLRDIARRIKDMWPAIIERYKDKVTSEVFSVAYPDRLIDRIQAAAEYLSHIIVDAENPFEVDMEADNMLRSLRARIRDGYIECLRILGVLRT